MPPKVKFTKEEIVAAAVNVARRRGLASVTTRDIAAELGVSTRPIFTYFKSMDEVRAEIRAAAAACFGAYMDEGLRAPVPFYGVGMQYLRFAQQEDVFCVDDRDAQRLLEEKERRALVQQALLALSDEDRELMLRRYFYNQSAEQIAREKDMNPGTVRSRLCRARQAMRAELEKGGIRFEDLCAEAL